MTAQGASRITAPVVPGAEDPARGGDPAGGGSGGGRTDGRGGGDAAPGPAATPGSGSAGRLLGLALASAAVLLLQLVQTRVFSVMLWHHLTYLVVTFTLLGFAAGGTVLACRPKWLAGDAGGRLAAGSLLFGLFVLGAYALVTRHPPATAHTGAGIATAAVSYAVLLVPMVFAGFVVALALSAAGPEVGRTYAVNMVGSAVGAALFVPALRALGGEGSVLLACALTFAAGWLFAQRGSAARAVALDAAGAPVPVLAHGGRRVLSVLCGAAALGAAVLAVVAPTAVFEVPVAPSKAMAQHLARDPGQRVELVRWDPLCRLDVIGPADPASRAARTIYQDGDASTVMVLGAAQDTVNIFDKEGLGYLAFVGPTPEKSQAPKVLAIGIGGGIDILQAQARARPVPPGRHVDFTGVEINRTTFGLLTNEYREATADRYHLPNTRIVLDEGRSWLRRSEERYDLIQMTGTDTYAALASGSYVMTESYLYTAEAYDDFLSHLTPDGIVSVLRFRFDPPRETLRLAAIAVDALRRDGAAHPEDHVLMIAIDGNKEVVDGRQVGIDYGALLFRKRPWKPDEVAQYVRYCDKNPRAWLMYAPGVETAGPAADYFAAVRAGTDAQFRAQYVYNLDPVDDDNPFFFRYERWGDAFSKLLGSTGALAPLAAGEAESRGRAAQEYTQIVGGEPIGLILLLTVLGESALLVALLVLVPLWLFKRGGLAVPGALRWILYFSGLGAGYILVEVVAMQRFVLYLGNPSYALSVVLVVFLLASGAGAALAGRSRDPQRTLARALLLVLVFVGGLALTLPALFAATLDLPLSARIALAALVLAPPAFVMGMPFPSGLALVGRRQAAFVPWAFGVNGGASVLASVIGILVAMAAGFSASFVLALAAYAMALLAGRGARA